VDGAAGRDDVTADVTSGQVRGTQPGPPVRAGVIDVQSRHHHDVSVRQRNDVEHPQHSEPVERSWYSTVERQHRSV